MSAPMTSVGVFQDAASRAVGALFDAAVAEQTQKLVYPHLGMTDFEPDSQDFQINAVTGPGYATLTLEGQPYQSNTIEREPPVTVTLRKQTSELAVTEEAAHWLDKARAGGKMVSELSSKVEHAVNALHGSIDREASQVHHLGFGTTGPVNSSGTIGNSEALFANHTLSKSGAANVRNTFASGDTHRPLASSALTDAIDIMNRFRGHNDIELLPVKDLLLVVSKNNAAAADQLLNSEYGPLTDVLGQNPGGQKSLGRRGITINYVVDPYIPSARSTYWFLIDKERAKRRWRMAWGWKPKMVNEPDPTTGQSKLLGSVYFRTSCHGFVHAFGSQGDSAAI